MGGFTELYRRYRIYVGYDDHDDDRCDTSRRVFRKTHARCTGRFRFTKCFTGYGVPRSTAPIGSRVVLNYDLTPAEWASGSVTMRFLVENYPKKVIPTFWRGRPCLAVTSVT